MMRNWVAIACVALVTGAMGETTVVKSAKDSVNLGAGLLRSGISIGSDVTGGLASGATTAIVGSTARAAETGVTVSEKAGTAALDVVDAMVGGGVSPLGGAKIEVKLGGDSGVKSEVKGSGSGKLSGSGEHGRVSVSERVIKSGGGRARSEGNDGISVEFSGRSGHNEGKGNEGMSFSGGSWTREGDDSGLSLSFGSSRDASERVGGHRGLGMSFDSHSVSTGLGDSGSGHLSLGLNGGSSSGHGGNIGGAGNSGLGLGLGVGHEGHWGGAGDMDVNFGTTGGGEGGRMSLQHGRNSGGASGMSFSVGGGHTGGTGNGRLGLSRATGGHEGGHSGGTDGMGGNGRMTVGLGSGASGMSVNVGGGHTGERSGNERVNFVYSGASEGHERGNNGDARAVEYSFLSQRGGGNLGGGETGNGRLSFEMNGGEPSRNNGGMTFSRNVGGLGDGMMSFGGGRNEGEGNIEENGRMSFGLDAREGRLHQFTNEMNGGNEGVFRFSANSQNAPTGGNIRFEERRMEGGNNGGMTMGLSGNGGRMQLMDRRNGGGMSVNVESHGEPTMYQGHFDQEGLRLNANGGRLVSQGAGSNGGIQWSVDEGFGGQRPGFGVQFNGREGMNEGRRIDSRFNERIPVDGGRFFTMIEGSPSGIEGNRRFSGGSGSTFQWNMNEGLEDQGSDFGIRFNGGNGEGAMSGRMTSGVPVEGGRFVWTTGREGGSMGGGRLSTMIGGTRLTGEGGMDGLGGGQGGSYQWTSSIDGGRGVTGQIGVGSNDRGILLSGRPGTTWTVGSRASQGGLGLGLGLGGLTGRATNSAVGLGTRMAGSSGATVGLPTIGRGFSVNLSQ